MSATTPPKGRPTTGRRDRTVASRRNRSRSTTKKFIWGLLAICVVGAVVVLGSGSGGGGNLTNTGINSNVVIPALLTLRLSALRWERDPRS